MSPFLRGMTGQQMGVGRRSLAQMLAPATAPTPTTSGPTMAAAQPLDIAGLRKQVLAQTAAPTAPQSRQALLAKYGLAPTAPAPKPSPMQRLSSAMPAAGTPQMAGLGAAGRAMLEMSGYQPIAQAPSIGQILARSAEAGIGAMEKKQAAEQTAAEKQAAAERQARLDELQRRNVESQIAARKKEEKTGPLSPEGKLATDYGLTPGTPEYAAFMEARIKEKQRTSNELTALQKEAAAIFPGDETKQAKWVRERRERPRGFTQRAGVVLDKDGKRVGRAIFNQSPEPGESPVKVLGEDGKPRDLLPGEKSVEQSLMNDLLIPQEKYMQIEKDILQGKQSMRKLDKYLGNVFAGKEGLGKTADQFITLGKTFFSEILPEDMKELSPSQLATAISQGQLQGLIGASRLEVVGGGVMTEQDALRIIQFLGGDVNAFQNKERVQEAIKYVLKEKAETYNLNARNYNEQTAYRGGTRDTVELIDTNQFDDLVVTSDDPTVPEGVDPSVWAVMTPEEKALWR